MQNMLKKIHREGFTWRDSLFIHGVIVLAIFLISQIPQSFLMILIPVWLSGMDGDFTQTLAFYGSFIVAWVILILFCIIVKSNRPILGSFWRGLKGNTVPKYLIGLLFGFGLNVLSIGAAVLHGDIRITWPGVAASAIGPLLILIVAVAVQCGSEEILYRGYYFQRLRKGYKNPAFAIFINPIPFMLAHVFNPGVTVLALMNVYLVGVIMSLMIYYFDSFWLAMAFHSAWNFSQNIIFGLPNSGNILGFSIGKLDTSAIGNSFFYNPNFGVEATGFTTLLMSVVFVVLLLLVCKRKKTPTDIWAKQQGRM